ncbi:hypothetical protein BD410DRAFT_794767 [Rickenella mellea]|uniref:Uncharacterized protein n=1 Tax=Rickenella mellea TaxID=50990 RepID=A0A4Y7PPK9_9AGAM|nr:hypothetical protein BD410DRAFT_794767 [Rickenella mellea]
MSDEQAKHSESAGTADSPQQRQVDIMNALYALSESYPRAPPAPTLALHNLSEPQAKQSESASMVEQMNMLYAQSQAYTQVPPAPITASRIQTNPMASQALKYWQNSIPLVSYTRPPLDTPKHAITPAELDAFKADPMSLVGRQFVHEMKDGESDDADCVWWERYEDEDEDEYIWFMVVSFMYGLDPHPREGQEGRKITELMLNFEGMTGMMALPLWEVEEKVSTCEVVDV